MEELFGSLFIALGPTLLDYLSIIDVYKIISSGIFGDINEQQWKTYFSSKPSARKTLNNFV